MLVFKTDTGQPRSPVRELALALDVSYSYAYALISGRTPVTPDILKKLSKRVEDPVVWLKNLETRYMEKAARRAR